MNMEVTQQQYDKIKDIFPKHRGNVEIDNLTMLNDGPQGRILLQELDEQFEKSMVLMDKAYEGNETRALVRSLHMTPVVPPKTNRKKP